MPKELRSRAVASIRCRLTQDIHHFHKKFGLDAPVVPQLLSPELFEFRMKFLQEELDEYKKAHEEGDLVNAFDALIDLVYVAIGTSYLHGLPFDDGWDRVQAANMAKERGTAQTSKRGSSFDVVKPPGWTPPDHTDLVGPFQLDAFQEKERHSTFEID